MNYTRKDIPKIINDFSNNLREQHLFAGKSSKIPSLKWLFVATAFPLVADLAIVLADEIKKELSKDDNMEKSIL